MKYETPCPACGQPISIWKRMVSSFTDIKPTKSLSTTLFFLKCSKCNTKIRLKGWTWPSLIIAMMIVGYLGVMLGWSYLIAYKHISVLSGFAIVVGAMIIWSIIWEIIASLLVINKGTFNRGKNSP